MKLRSIASLGVFLFLLPHAFSQNRFVVNGVVMDYESRKAISSVNVIVRGHKLGTITDSIGSFRLELPIGEQYVIVFSHVAYEKVTRIVSAEKQKEVEFHIYLTPQLVKLQEVVIMGEKPFVVTQAAEKSAKYRLDGTEFERLGEERMEKAMRYFLPDVVRPLLDRLSVKEKGERIVADTDEFTLYVDGEWRESFTLDDIDPFRIKRVLVWDANPFVAGGVETDVAPVAFSLRRGSRYVVLVETK